MFPGEWINYCKGDRSHTNGDFQKSLQAGRDVIGKGVDST